MRDIGVIFEGVSEIIWMVKEEEVFSALPVMYKCTRKIKPLVTTYYQLAAGWPEVLLSCMLNGSRNFEIPNYPCKFRLACYVNVIMFLSLKYIGVPRFAMAGFCMNRTHQLI
jgi:hypothetical protein